MISWERAVRFLSFGRIRVVAGAEEADRVGDLWLELDNRGRRRAFLVESRTELERGAELETRMLEISDLWRDPRMWILFTVAAFIAQGVGLWWILKGE